MSTNPTVHEAYESELLESKPIIAPRDLAYCGLFGAGALFLPVIFHLLHLGSLFMPMYLPLLALAFFARPLPTMATAAFVPIFSALVTGMPPFFPPIAVFMAIELSLIAGGIALVVQQFPKVNEWLVLAIGLTIGRMLYLTMVYLTAGLIELPQAFVTGASLISGWPGIMLMLIVVPPIARLRKRFQA